MGHGYGKAKKAGGRAKKAVKPKSKSYKMGKQFRDIVTKGAGKAAGRIMRSK